MRLLVFLAILAVVSPTVQDKKAATKTEPVVLLSIPLGAAPGKTTKLTLRGLNLDTAKEVRVDQGSVKVLNKGKAGVPEKNPEKVGDTQVEIELKLDAKINGDSVAVIVVTPAGEAKLYEVLVETKLPVNAEKEANDGFRAAQAISLPTVVDGTIGRQKDVDVFGFSGKKGQKVTAEVLASRRGSPLDAILTLYDAKMQQIVANDDFDKNHRDAKIEFTLPDDGVYYLSLIDAHDTGSNLHVYRLVVK